MGKRVAQDQVGVKVSHVVRAVVREGHDDVGVPALGLDEFLGVALPGIELGEHLVRRVSAPRAVALHLPRPAQLLRRSQRHADVVQRPERLGVEVEQSLHQQELRRAHVDRRLELSGLVAVHRLEHRLPAAEMPDVLGEDVEVVRVGMQGRDAELAPPPAVVAVVVVGRHVRHVRVAQHPREAAGDGGLAGARVADHAYDDRPRHRASRTGRRGRAAACLGSGGRTRRGRGTASGRRPSTTARRGPRSERERPPRAACP